MQSHSTDSTRPESASAVLETERLLTCAKQAARSLEDEIRLGRERVTPTVELFRVPVAEDAVARKAINLSYIATQTNPTDMTAVRVLHDPDRGEDLPGISTGTFLVIDTSPRHWRARAFGSPYLRGDAVIVREGRQLFLGHVEYTVDVKRDRIFGAVCGMYIEDAGVSSELFLPGMVYDPEADAREIAVLDEQRQLRAAS